MNSKGLLLCVFCSFVQLVISSVGYYWFVLVCIRLFGFSGLKKKKGQVSWECELWLLQRNERNSARNNRESEIESAWRRKGVTTLFIFHMHSMIIKYYITIITKISLKWVLQWAKKNGKMEEDARVKNCVDLVLFCSLCSVHISHCVIIRNKDLII